MSWIMIWGILNALKVMNIKERKLFFNNDGNILFDIYKSGRVNYSRPIGFDCTKQGGLNKNGI